MTVGIVGLGLIGGSFAKAYRQAGHEVLSCDRDGSILEFARMSGAVDGELTAQTVSRCDLVLIAVYPEAAVAWLREMAPYFGTHPVVMDCCGTKRGVCRVGFALAEEHGFTFLGGHPMAGTHFSGFKYADPDLYRGAPMVIVPPRFDDIELLARAKQLLAPAGFGRVAVTTAEEHDRVVAFTSQMAHVVSNAYIKSPTALTQNGVSAGSYKDMTRVAWLNPRMWAELFLENKDCLLHELDVLVDSLNEYRKAMEREDLPELIRLLDEGKTRKEEVDGK